MTDETNTKQKSPTPYVDTTKRWYALGLAFIFSLFMSLRIGVYYLDEYSEVPLFYPLLVIARYSPFQAILWVTAIIIFVGLLLYAANYNPILAVLSCVVFLVGGFFLFISFIWGVGGTHITLYQTLSSQNRIYHLVAKWEGAYDLGDETERYIVLECGSTGLVCEIHRTPYRLSLRNYTGKLLNEFDTSGEIYIDEAARKLMLRVGGEIYPILSINPT